MLRERERTLLQNRAFISQLLALLVSLPPTLKQGGHRGWNETVLGSSGRFFRKHREGRRLHPTPRKGRDAALHKRCRMRQSAADNTWSMRNNTETKTLEPKQRRQTTSGTQSWTSVLLAPQAFGLCYARATKTVNWRDPTSTVVPDQHGMRRGGQKQQRTHDQNDSGTRTPHRRLRSSRLLCGWGGNQGWRLMSDPRPGQTCQPQKTRTQETHYERLLNSTMFSMS